MQKTIVTYRESAYSRSSDGATAMRKIISHSSLALLIAGMNVAFAQDAISPVAVAPAAFYNLSGEPYLEIAYALEASVFTVSPQDSTLHALVTLELVRDDSMRLQDAWRIQSDFSQNGSPSAGNRVADLRRLRVSPGNYELRLLVRDLNREQSEFRASSSITVDPLPDARPALSDLELCATLTEANTIESPFIKGNYLVMPRIDGVFDQSTPRLYYYFEVYNLLKSLADPFYVLRVRVLDGQKNETAAVPSRDRRKRRPGESFVEVGMVDIQALNTGTFYLQCALLDTTGSVLASNSRKFFVSKGQVAQEQSGAGVAGSTMLTADLAGFSEDQLDEEFQKAAYIASKTEREAYTALQGAEAKRTYLVNFWTHRTTPVLDGRQMRYAYHKRISEANEKYSSFGRIGWQTARGRVYILYGRPDEERRYPNTDAARGYEEWRYDQIESGVEFIFVDRTGYGDYALVHSTKRGELRDEAWRRFLGGGAPPD